MYNETIKQLPLNKEVYNKSIELGYTDLQSSIIASKLTSVSDIEFVFNPRLRDIPDFLNLVSEVDNAVDLIEHAMKNNERIAIVVDYDCDGISSAAVLYRFFKNIFKYNLDNLEVIINKRENGNGIGVKLLNTILTEHKRNPINLVITADHGSANGSSIEMLQEHNIKVVVTDHHLVPDDGSARVADAFVNPQKDKNETFKSISGCAVAFFTAYSLAEKYGYTDVADIYNMLPIVAISTIGDAMDLSNPINRALTISGLKELNSLKDPLWQAVKYLLDVNVLMDEETLGFNIVPALNAASRMGQPDAAFKFYIAEEYRDAVISFEKLLEINADRKKLQKHLTRNALLQCINAENEDALVITLTQGLGLNGIVSSSVGEKYNKPVVTFIKDGDSYHGSGRAINPNFDLHAALSNIKEKAPDVLIKFGGHKGAAGCEVHADKINDFKKLLGSEAKEQLTGKETKKVHYVIGKIENDKLNESIINEIKTLSPFGMKFNKIFFVGDFTLHKVIYIGRDSEHVNLKLLDNHGTIYDSFIFNFDNKFDEDLLERDMKIRIVYRPVLNTFKGNIELRLEIEHINKL